MPQIIDQKIERNEETSQVYLVTKYDDGSIENTPVTSEEAAQWEAEHRF